MSWRSRVGILCGSRGRILLPGGLMVVREYSPEKGGTHLFFLRCLTPPLTFFPFPVSCSTSSVPSATPVSVLRFLLARALADGVALPPRSGDPARFLPLRVVETVERVACMGRYVIDGEWERQETTCTNIPCVTNAQLSLAV